ncbi:hypothetical protein G9A89_019976 [Geosiphon pyriformis]|nr:hypothetical protein G9A89_019976 [Geosiphon pyriformis]
MAYAPIVKLEKFTGKKNNAQVWLNNVKKVITANRWDDTRAMQYQSLVNKLQDFNTFKLAFLQYFKKNKAVTIYLGHFHRNLHQIQTIQANYFTVSQILNQFIKGLHSSILQCICSMHPADLQAAVTNARDFEAAELKANHVQAINLVMNRSSDLNSKLKQFSDSINQKLEGYLADNCTIYQPSQQCNNSENANLNKVTLELTVILISSNAKLLFKSRLISTHLSANNAAANLLTTTISNSNLSATATSNLSITAISNLLTPTNLNTATNHTSKQNPQAENNTTKLEIGNGSLPTDSQFISPINRISLVEFGNWAHPKPEFPILFKFSGYSRRCHIKQSETQLTVATYQQHFTSNEETINTPLFSGAALKEKLITVMYIDAKIDGHSIKLILDSGLAGSIITKQFINQLGH